MAEYKETAKEIIKKAIKSAIFIDENALEPYVQDEKVTEGERSVALFTNFREMGISLDVWKYDKAQYGARQEYIFNGRDLLLLDWKLEGEGNGGERALEILSDLVNEHKQVHFCVVYTAEDPKDVMPDLLSYFSLVTKEGGERIKSDLADYEDEIKSVESELKELSYYRFNKDKQKELKIKIRSKLNDKVNAIHEYFKQEDPSILVTDALVMTGLAFNRHIKSSTLQISPISIDEPLNTLYINNTFISVMSKKDVTPEALFDTFAEAIANCKYGVMPLIGVEYQNIQRETGGVLDGALTRISPEALGCHKKASSEDFETFLKSILMEQDALHGRQKSLSIVEVIQQCNYSSNLEDEYARLNVFYNSTILTGERYVSFGDVFKSGEDYYMCITALCDCLRPSKRNNKFYFVKGASDSKASALEIGDEGFVSFLPNKECVRWNSNKSKGHTPVDIVPESYLVPNNIIQDGKLVIFQSVIGQDGQPTLQSIGLTYIATIKQNYAQRIANQAFVHPARVGVDFIKKEEEQKESKEESGL